MVCFPLGRMSVVDCRAGFVMPTDMVEYLSTEKPIHTQEKRVDDFHRAFG
jgi:hypothetical protein